MDKSHLNRLRSNSRSKARTRHSDLDAGCIFEMDDDNGLPSRRTDDDDYSDKEEEEDDLPEPEMPETTDPVQYFATSLPIQVPMFKHTSRVDEVEAKVCIHCIFQI